MMPTPEMLGPVFYGGAFGLVLLGLYAVMAGHHLMRVILGLLLVEAGANLFLVAIGYRPDAAAPIVTGSAAPGPMVDPLPQALVLTAIVIGVGVLALALALVVRVQEAYGTLDAREVAERLAEETGDLSPLPQSAGEDAMPPAVRNAGKVRESEVL